MKKTIAILLLSAMTTAFANEEPAASANETTRVEQSFGYVGLGLGPFPIPLPAFSAGFRSQAGHHGFDVNLQAQTIIEATQLKMNGLYLHFFKPNVASEFYAGGGLGVSTVFGHHHDHAFLISPELVFGKQYRNESDDTRFFQAQMSFPTLPVDSDFHAHRVFWFPLVVLSYGIGF